ncbi:hypothetical protein PUN28_010167 [Cardiocondyla obscurior]|uniref:Uncharacterized protein n=1 Tax=Cardiocondyla obscurior TaxID=286306 RepID=A0AAW2FSJ2_9HYME
MAGSRLISAYDDITRAQRATQNYCKPRPLNIPSAAANHPLGSRRRRRRRR